MKELRSYTLPPKVTLERESKPKSRVLTLSLSLSLSLLGKHRCLVVLLEEGARVDVLDRDLWTPLMWAVEGNHVVRREDEKREVKKRAEHWL
jgi:ankyrin repeat protein